MERPLSFIYEGVTIDIDSVDMWFKLTKKAENDKANKHREHIIGAILNGCVPSTYFTYSRTWKRMKDGLDAYIRSIHPHESIRTLACRHIGGRRFSYDFLISVNGTEYKVEFKFNVSTIEECPEFVSPGKPSDFLSSSYEEYYYDHYLSNLCKEAKIDVPERKTYVRTINGNIPKCIAPLKELYKLNDDFNALAKSTAKKSIEDFLTRTRLDTTALSSYLRTSQDEKVYMLYKNETFVYQTRSSDSYTIESYETQPTKSCFVATMKTGDKIKILLRWKNGNGIAFPAFQISLLKKDANANAYEKQTLKSLKEIAKQKGIKGLSAYTSKTKAELIRKIEQN